MLSSATHPSLGKVYERAAAIARRRGETGGPTGRATTSPPWLRRIVQKLEHSSPR